MIGSLRGTVLDRQGSPGGAEVLIEVAGVGYLVMTTPAVAAELAPGSEALVYVHHHVREDVDALYGFTSRPARSTFATLIGTHGVGPALALAILSTHDPAALGRIVAEGDIAALTQVPGVGRKTAERLVIELKSRLDTPLEPVVTTVSGSAAAQVREALGELGYTPDEIRRALQDVAGEAGGDSADDAAALLRRALGSLGARRA